MATGIAIQAEDLGKKYTIGHADHAERYATLRDALSRGARGASRQLRDIAAGRPIISGQTTEDFWALRGVSFEIKAGDVVGVIGRNGAGKSTLLKILSRITEPSEGRVTIDGRVASLLEVGTGFHPELTGRENIFLNGAIMGMSRSRMRATIDEIVDFAEVAQFLDTPVKRYSSGMYVRLAFAVAAHVEADILIIDEVLAVGDADFQRKCLGKMSEVAGGGRTVLLVSHSLSAISKLCSKALLLHRGNVQLFGNTNSVVDEFLQDLSTNNDADYDARRPIWAKRWITRVGLRDSNGAERDVFLPGEAITLEMHFSGEDHPPLKRPVMGLVFNHRTKGLIASVNTRMTGFDVKESCYESGVYRCTLVRPPFLAGQYEIDVWLGDGLENVDTISAASTVSVIDGNPYESGSGPFHEVGAVFLDPTWRLSTL